MIGAYHILLDFRPVICGRLAYGSSKQGSEWGIDMTSRHAVFGYQRMQQADRQSRTYDVINTLGFPSTSASYTHENGSQNPSPLMQMDKIVCICSIMLLEGDDDCGEIFKLDPANTDRTGQSYTLRCNRRPSPSYT